MQMYFGILMSIFPESRIQNTESEKCENKPNWRRCKCILAFSLQYFCNNLFTTLVPTFSYISLCQLQQLSSFGLAASRDGFTQRPGINLFPRCVQTVFHQQWETFQVIWNTTKTFWTNQKVPLLSWTGGFSSVWNKTHFFGKFLLKNHQNLFFRTLLAGCWTEAMWKEL